MPIKDPHYVNEFEEEDLYKLKEKEKERLKDRSVLEGFEEERPPELIERKIRTRAAMPRMEEDHIKPLKRLSPEIVGTLFDRVNFLEERLKEIRDILDIRKNLHEDIMKEIDADIGEKEEMESRVQDMDEKRNIKLDISILRKEKRHESVQFWNDITELKSELRELLEKHETETKITSLFEGLKGEKGEDE